MPYADPARDLARKRAYDRTQRQRVGSYCTVDWKAKRKAVLERDPVCMVPGCGKPSKHADHIVPRRHGGSDELDNLQGLCHSHHSAKTAAEDSRFAASAKPKRTRVDGLPADRRHPWCVHG